MVNMHTRLHCRFCRSCNCKMALRHLTLRWSSAHCHPYYLHRQLLRQVSQEFSRDKWLMIVASFDFYCRIVPVSGVLYQHFTNYCLPDLLLNVIKLCSKLFILDPPCLLMLAVERVLVLYCCGWLRQ